jgi:hypothetical protein
MGKGEKAMKALVRAHKLARGEISYENLIRKAITMNDSDCKKYLCSFIQDVDTAKDLVSDVHNLLTEMGYFNR